MPIFANWQTISGAASAPNAAIQNSSLLNGYAIRPPWPVAGVNYAVGYPTSAILSDWSLVSSVNSGSLTITSTNFRVDNATGLNLDLIDFSLHNGGNINLVNCTNTTITNCKFGGTNLRTVLTGVIQTDSASSGLTVNNCVFDGAAINISGVTNSTTAAGNKILHFASTPAGIQNGLYAYDVTGGATVFAPSAVLISSFDGTTVTVDTNAAGAGVGNGDTISFFPTLSAFFYHQGGGATVIKYNWFKNWPCQILQMSAAGSVDYRFNFIDTALTGTTQHQNYLQFGSGIITSCLVQFNTTYQTNLLGAEGFQFYFNGSGTLISPELSYNTMIAIKNGASDTMSYMNHAAGASATGTTILTGRPFAHHNYFDPSGTITESSAGCFYPSSFNAYSSQGSGPAWVMSNNWNMVTGAAVPNNP